MFRRMRSRIGQWRDAAAVRRHYSKGDYMEAYASHTDMRVDADPRAAIGGMWEEIGRLQFQFLVSEGLQPTDRMLDVGCGTLRGGRHFIRYLDKGRYVGFDMSPRAIEAAWKLVRDEGLNPKEPRLFLNEGGSLRFESLTGDVFDVILAQSVFTHLQEASIQECFANVGNVMAEGGRFYFTFASSEFPTRRSPKDYAYPFSFFEAVASAHGLQAEDVSNRYHHPRAQGMVVATRR